MRGIPLPGALMLAIWAATSLAGLAAGSRDAEAWPPIRPEDLALQDNPKKPGSSAMILFKSEVRNEKKRTWDFFYRVKIFTELGRDHANIEIPYAPKRTRVEKIAGRVIQPDGRIIEFAGPIYEKVLVRQRRTRFLAKSFTLPEVHPGVILDYRYRLKLKSDGFFSPMWIVQEGLFVREAQLELHLALSGRARVVRRGIPDGSSLLGSGVKVRRATLRDLPAFEREPYLPPEQMLKARFIIVYEWPFSTNDLINRTHEKLQSYIGRTRDYRPFVEEILRSGDPDEDKLRQLYTAVHERVRNLSYEEEYSRKERKREGMKTRNSAKEVWRLGYGTSREIVLLFVGLCRAAGFRADPVEVVQRHDKLFDSDIPLYLQLDGLLAVVELPSGEVYYDPGVRFAPPGWISWPRQGVYGVRMKKKTKALSSLETPSPAPAENTLHERATVELRPDGSARVALSKLYTGNYLVSRRNQFFELSDAEREKSLREELEEHLPEAQIERVSWEGMDDPGEEGAVSWRFELPSLAQTLGNRLILPAMLLRKPSPFPSWQRTHPVYLRVSANYSRETRIVPPPGYQLEHIPKSRAYSALVGDYGSITSQQEDAIIVNTRMVTHATILETGNYVELKRFFDAIAADSQTHLVFIPK